MSVDLPATMGGECPSQHEPVRLKERGPGRVTQTVGEAGRPSTSLKRKVTTPSGRASMRRMLAPRPGLGCPVRFLLCYDLTAPPKARRTSDTSAEVGTIDAMENRFERRLLAERCHLASLVCSRIDTSPTGLWAPWSSTSGPVKPVIPGGDLPHAAAHRHRARDRFGLDSRRALIRIDFSAPARRPIHSGSVAGRFTAVDPKTNLKGLSNHQVGGVPPPSHFYC